jgi:hypothetical protein
MRNEQTVGLRYALGTLFLGSLIAMVLPTFVQFFKTFVEAWRVIRDAHAMLRKRRDVRPLRARHGRVTD